MPPCITDVTPTVCRLMDITPPVLCQAEPLAAVLDHAREALGGRSVQRLLLYAPDAIGCHLLPRDPASFNAVRACAPLELRVQSVHPSVTPVCFTSMFTGAVPKVHGIRHYIKPVLACDTLFDALLRAGKRVAIVAVKKSSIDIMFRGRVLQYFSEDYDAQVTARTIELLARNEHDFILAYHQEYDDHLHMTEPFSPECLAAFQHHAASFAELCQAVDAHWAGYDRAVAFTPDHGAHFNAVAGRGAHGENINEDMDLAHFWGVRAAQTHLA
jgi:hypothetical protein